MKSSCKKSISIENGCLAVRGVLVLVFSSWWVLPAYGQLSQVELEALQKEVALIEITAQLSDIRSKLSTKECSPALIPDLERLLTLGEAQQALLPAASRKVDEVTKAALHSKLGELYAEVGDVTQRDHHWGLESTEKSKIAAKLARAEDLGNLSLQSEMACKETK